jgi:hypothetical protein
MTYARLPNVTGFGHIVKDDEATVAQALALIRLLSRIKVRLGLLIIP